MTKSKDKLLVNIDNLIVEINAQYDNLKQNKQLEGLEIALLASKIDYLSAQVKALHYCEEPKQNHQNAVKEQVFFTPSIVLDKEADEQEIFDEIEQEQPVTMMQEVPKVEIFSAYVESVDEKVEEEIVVSSPAPEPTPVFVPIPEVVVEKVVVAPVVEKVQEVEVEEEASSRPLTINELIQQQKQAGVNMTQQFQTSSSQDKVVDLKIAISLNDKLLFIKDLFNGYSLAYSEALELLNRFDNYAEADAFLQSNYALKNGWAEKPQTVDKFYALLRKKFN